MLERTEEANGIFAFQFFTEHSCRSVVSHVRNFGSWEEAGIRQTSRDGDFYSANNPSVRSAAWWCGPDESKIYGIFDKKIDCEIKPFVEQAWQLKLTEHSGTQIVRYRPGGHYVAHRDAGLDLQDRYFTLVCYLNDDFEGGKTRFTSFNYSSTPKTGKMVLFPSIYLHQAEPVLSGEKYVFITWLIGPPPIKWI